MRELTQADRDNLETLVDRTSVASVLRALETIAYEKATHIRDNWQDDRTASVWIRAGRVLERASQNPVIREVSL